MRYLTHIPPHMVRPVRRTPRNPVNWLAVCLALWLSGLTVTLLVLSLRR